MNDQENIIKLIPDCHLSGLISYIVKTTPHFAQTCDDYDKRWNVDFRTHIGPNYPYTMSPKTTEIIAKASLQLKQTMTQFGFLIDPWKMSPSNEPYVLGVLRRVLVPDTIEPIIGYTDEMADFLENSIRQKPRNLRIRSFFCGAAVADKCLLVRLYEKGISANLIATDHSADSIAIAAMNFSIWNELLPEKQKYEIHIVNGSIPVELFHRERIIVLQVFDAICASGMEIDKPVSYDALLLDNGLQYVTKEYSTKLIANVIKKAAFSGLYIGALGLDSQIEVNISPLSHIWWVILSLFLNLPSYFAKIYTCEAPYPYAYKYRFRINKNSQTINISGVFSNGAARTYTWLGILLFSNRKRFFEVMKAIKSATYLSKISAEVITSPFEYHNSIVNVIEAHGLDLQVLEKPLDFEKFGWKQIGSDLYDNGKTQLEGEQMMRKCKEQDPLVLRRSRIFCKPKDQYYI